MRLHRPTGYYGEGDAPCAPEPCSHTQCSCYEDVSVPWLWHNLSIAGALCAAHELGADPPTVTRVVARLEIGDAVTVEMWRPGCQWPAR